MKWFFCRGEYVIAHCFFFGVPLYCSWMNVRFWMAVTTNQTGSLFIMHFKWTLFCHHTWKLDTKPSHLTQTARFDRILKTHNYFSHTQRERHTHSHSHHRSFRIQQIVTHVSLYPQFSSLLAFNFDRFHVSGDFCLHSKWFAAVLGAVRFAQIVLAARLCSPWKSSTTTTATVKIACPTFYTNTIWRMCTLSCEENKLNRI